MKSLTEGMRRCGEKLSESRPLRVAVGAVAVAGFLDTLRLRNQHGGVRPSIRQDGEPKENFKFCLADSAEPIIDTSLIPGSDLEAEVNYDEPSEVLVDGHTVILTKISVSNPDADENLEPIRVVMPLGFSASLYPPEKRAFSSDKIREICSGDVDSTRKTCEGVATSIASLNNRNVVLVVPESQGLGGSSTPTSKQAFFGYFGKYDKMLEVQLDAVKQELETDGKAKEVLFMGYSRGGRMAAHMAEIWAKKYGPDRVTGFIAADPPGTVVRNWLISLIKLMAEGPGRGLYDETVEPRSATAEMRVGYEFFGTRGLLSLVESMGLNNPGLPRTIKNLGRMGVEGTVACISGSTISPQKGHAKMAKLCEKYPSLEFIQTDPEDLHNHAAVYSSELDKAFGAIVKRLIGRAVAVEAEPIGPPTSFIGRKPRYALRT
jgi:pimeloyl-ACP methyl ester carboxylesterase